MYMLMLSILGKNFSRPHFKIFFLLILEKRVLYIISVSSAEYAHRVVKVKDLFYYTNLPASPPTPPTPPPPPPPPPHTHTHPVLFLHCLSRWPSNFVMFWFLSRGYPTPTRPVHPHAPNTVFALSVRMSIHLLHFSFWAGGI